MKIAFLPTTFENRRDESLHLTLILLAKEFKLKGHEVVIVAPGNKRFPSEETFEGIKVHRGPIITKSRVLNRFFSAIFKLKELENKGECFDVLHNFSAAKFFVLKPVIARFFLKREGIKIIHSLKSYSKFNLGNKLTKLLNLADLVTVPTKTFANSLIKGGCKKHKIAIMRSPINLNKFKPKNKLRSKIKIKLNYKFILYYGGISPDKGSNILRKLIPLVAKKTNLKFVVILRNQILDKYQDLINVINKEKKAIFIQKSIENMEDYVNAADIVILPYKTLIATEGNPSCLLESMACMTPVITTDLPELKEIAKPMKELLLFKSDSPSELIDCINRLLNNPKLKRTLVNNAYELSKQFSAKKITNRLLEIYPLRNFKNER